MDPTPDAEAAGWQWWKISYSTADAQVISTTASPSPAPEQGSELTGWGVPKISASEWARKARQHGERNADRAGFSVQKVREVEVLKAARDESTKALLVYASERAVNHDFADLPPQLKVRLSLTHSPTQSFITGLLPIALTHLPAYTTLPHTNPPEPPQNFVRADNLAFAAELGTDTGTPTSPRLTPAAKRKADDDDDDDDNGPNHANDDDDDEEIPWGGLPSTATVAHPPSSSASTDPTLPRYVPPPQPPQPPPRHPARPSALSSGPGTDERGRSYDERIPTSLMAAGSPLPSSAGGLDGGGGGDEDVEMEMEMEERGAGEGGGRGPRLGFAAGL